MVIIDEQDFLAVFMEALDSPTIDDFRKFYDGEDADDIWEVAHISIREIRAASGLSQAAFGAKYGIPRRTIEDWESSRRTPSPYIAFLLALASGFYKHPLD